MLVRYYNLGYNKCYDLSHFTVHYINQDSLDSRLLIFSVIKYDHRNQLANTSTIIIILVRIQSQCYNIDVYMFMVDIVRKHL